MENLLDRNTCLTMAGAFIVALLCVLPATRNLFPFWIMGAGLHIASTLFHELGHTLFSWLFGRPAIPMIFTLFGASQAGGMSIYLQRLWLVQIAAFAGLGYGCYWLKQRLPDLFIPAIIFSVAIMAVSFTRFYPLVIAYMGHGGSIAMGGFFLFRAWTYLDSRNQYERWLNALFGFFLTLFNFYFSYKLAFDNDARDDYMEHVAFGVAHNDFWAMALREPALSVKGIAMFTMGYCMATIIVSFVLAVWSENRFNRMTLPS